MWYLTDRGKENLKWTTEVIWRVISNGGSVPWALRSRFTLLSEVEDTGKIPGDVGTVGFYDAVAKGLIEEVR